MILGDSTEGLTKERWEELNVDGVVKNENEVYRLVYYGGVDDGIRKQVWPYLLGYYPLVDMTAMRMDLIPILICFFFF